MRSRKIHWVAALSVMLAAGCDAVLGLEHRTLYQPDAGTGSGSGTTSTSTGGTGGSASSTSSSSEGGASSSGGGGGTSIDCVPGQKQCAGNLPQLCDDLGHWQDGMVCAPEAPRCVAGACVVPPSCVGLPTTCGPNGNENCCTSPSLPKGTYNRSNDPAYPATVGDFRLDRFQITVGRFRKFLMSYPGNKPKLGDGEHPGIAGSGWQDAWDGNLAVDQAALRVAVNCGTQNQTWTDPLGANENKPMNCIDWYEAFAFCAWDGGSLPTEAEWNYAAAGGDEQRQYPWSNPPSSMTIDSTFAVYNGSPIATVGSKSAKGDGRWGQADLEGGVSEWNLDWLVMPYLASPCGDCAVLSQGSAISRVTRNGGWFNAASGLLSSARYGGKPGAHGSLVGARCGRTL